MATFRLKRPNTCLKIWQTACPFAAESTFSRYSAGGLNVLDFIVRGGLIHDGTGAEGYTGDVGIAGGRIVTVGRASRGSAKEVIDADGALVTPAWIELHTHYDGQATWDEAMEPSAGHGVGTVIMGNCGVGFAPVRPDGEQELIDLMEGVEDIPGAAL